MRSVTQRSFTSIAVALSLVLMGLAIPPHARAAVVVNDKIPFAIGVGIPCSADFVVLTGDLHILITSETDNNGGTHFKTHFQPQGISGISVNGVKYQGTGGTQQHVNIHSGLAAEFTFVNNFRMIGQGPGNNLLVHQVSHVTINANGDVTANVSNTSVECK